MIKLFSKCDSYTNRNRDKPHHFGIGSATSHAVPLIWDAPLTCLSRKYMCIIQSPSQVSLHKGPCIAIPCLSTESPVVPGHTPDSGPTLTEEPLYRLNVYKVDFCKAVLSCHHLCIYLFPHRTHFFPPNRAAILGTSLFA